MPSQQREQKVDLLLAHSLIGPLTHLVVPKEFNAVGEVVRLLLRVPVDQLRDRVVEVTAAAGAAAAPLADGPALRSRHHEQLGVAEARLADAAEAEVQLGAVVLQLLHGLGKCDIVVAGDWLVRNW